MSCCSYTCGHEVGQVVDGEPHGHDVGLGGEGRRQLLGERLADRRAGDSDVDELRLLERGAVQHLRPCLTRRVVGSDAHGLARADRHVDSPRSVLVADGDGAGRRTLGHGEVVPVSGCPPPAHPRRR